MKLFLAALATTSALTSVAFGADKPVISPAPAWVRPVAPLTLPATADEASVRILLSDQQVGVRTPADHPANLRKPLGYEAAKSGVAAARGNTPLNALEYGRWAGFFIDQGMRKDALADYSKAMELDPTSVWAWSNRGITKVQEGDLVGARADLNKAEWLAPTYVQVFIGQGMLADVEHHPKDAINVYTKALQQEAGNEYALTQRAAADAVSGDQNKATADRSAKVDAAVAANPEPVSPYLDPGTLMLDIKRVDDAIKSFDKVLSLEPKNVTALSERGMARALKGDLEAASDDLNVAASIDPKNVFVFRTRGLIAQQKGAWGDAITAYTSALQLEPSSGFALGNRAQAARAVGDNDAALRDAAAAIIRIPGWIGLYLLRANVLRDQGKQVEVIAEARAVTTANPNNSYAYVVAASIYSALYRHVEAMQAYDKAIALKPEAYIYFNRSLRRPKADVAGRQADLDAALKLDPNYIDAIAEKATLQADTGDLPRAISTYSSALAKAPDDFGLLIGRGVAYTRSNDIAHAEADFRRARDTAPEPVFFNSMCWEKAAAGVALESALKDCNAALAKSPDLPGYLDSRGLVLLRLGRLDEAIADYDRALAKSPDMPSALFGRAVAWARKGNRVKSESDAAAAAKIDTDVRADFEHYGVRL